MSVVEEILLAASRLGLTDGERAFIHLDTRSALNASLHLAVSVPFVSRSAAVNSSEADRLMTAAQALLIVQAHAVSLADVSTTPYKVCLAAVPFISALFTRFFELNAVFFVVHLFVHFLF